MNKTVDGDMIRFTVLGGSSIATPELIDALIPYIEDDRRIQVILYGRDATKLELVGRICRQMVVDIPGLQVQVTTNLADALHGADYILNQVRIGGLSARAYDEIFPHRWQIPGEETVGPGGAANALRSIPVVLSLCKTIEEIAPDATLLTFSNPSSVIQRAIMQTTGLKVVGLCDAPYTMHKTVAQVLGVAPENVDTQYVGMHHFGWITSAIVEDIEVLPTVLASDDACLKLGIDPEIGRVTGTLPHPYFRYFFQPDRMLVKQKAMSQPRAEELRRLEGDLLAAYAAYSGSTKPEALKMRSAIWYSTVIAPVIAALAFSVPARLAVNLRNDGLVKELSADTIIEVTADLVDKKIQLGHPRKLPPPSMLALLQMNAAYEALLVDAILNDSSDLLVEAFLINPLIPSYDVAKALVAELWPTRGMPESN